jgi:hypothetical protein
VKRNPFSKARNNPKFKRLEWWASGGARAWRDGEEWEKFIIRCWKNAEISYVLLNPCQSKLPELIERAAVSIIKEAVAEDSTVISKVTSTVIKQVFVLALGLDTII